ncbi:MAG: cupin domain-containing protein [Hyphomonadaceae bacterium]|nr:cupin domain-containing protein [Hyphomonadaceae bacterium]
MPNRSLPGKMIDQRGFSARETEVWSSHMIRSGEIAEAIGMLSQGPAGRDGRREALVAHPSSQEPGIGLSPGIAVAFGVLLPGETTRPRRHNASSFTMALSGTAKVEVGDRSFDVTARDSWNTPGMRVETLTNTGPEPFTYVSYSNAPLLQKLEVFYEEFDPAVGDKAVAESEVATSFSTKIARAKEAAGGPVDVGESGAMLLPYEHLIDPDFVESHALLWRWEDLADHLGLVRSLTTGYTGRPLWCLYNPATGTRNGTTFSFFATMTAAGPNFTGPAHKHVSAAINYILDGSGYSIVDGVRLDWEAGDIMLSAPGWAPHGHATKGEGAVILTIQDHPLHIGMESLIWQEDIKGGPILTLGSQAGFETNLAEIREASDA